MVPRHAPIAGAGLDRATDFVVWHPSAVIGLAALVKEELKTDPFCGVIYVFRAKRADRVKLLFWDGTGLVLVSKRLEDGRFRWPKLSDGVMRLTPAQLTALIEGLDWTRVYARRVRQPQEVQ